MAKDDYHVIVYQVLKIIYKCLKEGKEVDGIELFDWYRHTQMVITQNYWNYIIDHMMNDGLLETKSETKRFIIDQYVYIGTVQISPKGIEYLHENKNSKKVMRFLRENKEIIPKL